MMWRDTIELLPDPTEQDDYGDSVDGDSDPPVPKIVFANKRSVRQSEFYQAKAVGLKPDVVFEIREIEYADEETLKFEGVTYHIIRTFSKNGEILELVCSRSPLEG